MYRVNNTCCNVICQLQWRPPQLADSVQQNSLYFFYPYNPNLALTFFIKSENRKSYHSAQLLLKLCPLVTYCQNLKSMYSGNSFNFAFGVIFIKYSKTPITLFTTYHPNLALTKQSTTIILLCNPVSVSLELYQCYWCFFSPGIVDKQD